MSVLSLDKEGRFVSFSAEFWQTDEWEQDLTSSFFLRPEVREDLSDKVVLKPLCRLLGRGQGKETYS